MLRAELIPIAEDLINIAQSIGINISDLGWEVRGEEGSREIPGNTADVIENALIIREKAVALGNEHAQRRVAENFKQLIDSSSEFDEDSYRTRILEYQRSVNDYCMANQIFNELTNRIAEDFGKRKTKNFLLHLKNLLEAARNYVTSIYGRLSKYFRSIVEDLRDKLDNFENVVSKKIDDIIEWVRGIYDRLQDLFYALITGFVRFCQGVREYFQKTGLFISEIELKLPTLNVKIVQIGPVPVPVLEASPPEVTLTIGFSPK